jgi:hypothetical protein
MIDKEKPLTSIKLLSPETTDAVYAVNKAGDFSKKSVREPEWPQNADDKRPLSELNENKSLGAARFEDVKRRMIMLGDAPRGLAYVSPYSGGTDKDNAMGVVPLPQSGELESWKERLKSMEKLMDQNANPPSVPDMVPKSKAKLVDHNDPGHNEDKGRRIGGNEVVLADASEARPVYKLPEMKNRDLKTLD